MLQDLSSKKNILIYLVTFLIDAVVLPLYQAPFPTFQLQILATDRVIE